MVVSGVAVAGFAIGGTDAVAELGNLQRGPVELPQCCNQASNHTGLAHTPRMSADHYKGHRAIFAGFGRFKNSKLYRPFKGRCSRNPAQALQDLKLLQRLKLKGADLSVCAPV